MWPGLRVIERNPFPFFPFNPRWHQRLSREDMEIFCALLKLAWISDRPGYLPSELSLLREMLDPKFNGRQISEVVLTQFNVQDHTGLMYFPPQLRALHRLVNGEDMYSLLWDESL